MVNSPNREPHLLIPFSSSATAKFLGPHYRKAFENLAPFLETTLLRVCLHHSTKAARLTAQSSGQFQSSHTCPLGSIELYFPSNFYFTCLLRTTPPTSFTSSSLPHLLIPPLKKKKKAFLMLGLHEAWLLCLHHSLFNIISLIVYFHDIAAAAAKSLQSCPTLCDPTDGCLPGSSVPGILQARTLNWVVISFSNAWKWKVKVKLLSRVQLFETSWIAAYQAPQSMGFSRQEYWSGFMTLGGN